MLADSSVGSASNAAIGQWVVIAVFSLGVVGVIMAVASYFATRREVEKIETRVTKLEENNTKLGEQVQKVKDDLIYSADRRSSVLHNRINPIVENLSALKASSEAFVTAFNNFTRIVEARDRNERHK